LIVGLGLLVASMALEAALFTTSLERRFFTGAEWSLIVVGLEILSAVTSARSRAAKRDALGWTALIVGHGGAAGGWLDCRVRRSDDAERTPITRTL
jgi:hypothetical protein